MLSFCACPLLCRQSASEALDEYLGRQELRQLPLEPEAETDADHPCQPSDPAMPGVLPGTRMQLVGAEARRVDRCATWRSAAPFVCVIVCQLMVGHITQLVEMGHRRHY